MLFLVAVLCGSIAAFADSPIKWSPRKPTAGSPVTFAYTGDGDPQRWCFDSFSDCTNKKANQTTATHTYEEAGTYEVAVLVGVLRCQAGLVYSHRDGQGG